MDCAQWRRLRPSRRTCVRSERYSIHLVLQKAQQPNYALGIYLSNTPGAVDDATATTALYLLISTLRQYSIAERSLRVLKWKPSGLSSKTHDLTGRTVAILGLGGIGLRFAELLQSFPMRVIYHSRRKVADAPAYCEYFENVEEMLAQADVLSIHVPLRAETVGLVGEKMIRALKPGAIIINTARGKVIDENAMIAALEDGHVSGWSIFFACGTHHCLNHVSFLLLASMFIQMNLR